MSADSNGGFQVEVLDMNDLPKKQDFMRRIGQLHDLWEFRYKRRRKVRSKPQNDWFHAQIVPALKDALYEFNGERHTEEACKQMLKDQFLVVETRIVDTESGEVRYLRRTRGTSELDTKEFSDFCEDCRDLLAKYFGVIVPDPDPLWRLRDEQAEEEAA